MGIGLAMWTVILTAFIALTVAHAAFGDKKLRTNWEIIKQYRPLQFITTIPVLMAVIAVAILLYNNVPLMDKNPILWVLSSLFGWGDGSGQGNIMLSGLQWKYYAMIFLPVLLFALPTLAKYEEEDFRRGTRNWSEGIKRSIKFGLAHTIAFIPIGAALALSIGGMWFTYQYFKGGTERSTVYHAVYNSIVVVFLFVAVVLV